MSTNLQNLSLEEQGTLNRPDFRPLINPDFTPFELQHDLEEACAGCLSFDSNALPQPRDGESHIRRRDVKDFCGNWVHGSPNSLTGYWSFDSWGEDIGEDAMTPVQYKTFRVCVQAGPIEGKVIVSTADLRGLLKRYLREYPEDISPCVVVYSIYDRQPIQFLIILEPEDLLRQSIARFDEEEEDEDGDTGRGAVYFEQERVSVDEQTLRAIHAFRASKHFDDLFNFAQSIREPGEDRSPMPSLRADRADANVFANRRRYPGP